MLEIKDLLTAFDIEGDPEKLTLEEVTKLRDKKYIGRDVVHEDKELVGRLVGRRVGEIETNVKSTFKELGVNFEDGELKEKPVEEVLKLGKERAKSLIETLRENANKGNDEKVTKLQKDYEKLQGKFEEVKGLHENANKLIEKITSEKENEIKSFKLNSKIAEAKSKIQLSESVNDFMKKGIESTMSERYAVDIDGDELIVTDKKDGARIKDPTTGTKFLSYEDVYKQVVSEANALKVNGGGKADKKEVKTDDKPKQQIASRF